MAVQDDPLTTELLNSVLPENPTVSATSYLVKLVLLLLTGATAIGAVHFGFAAFSRTGLLNEGWGWGALLVYCLQVGSVLALPWFSYSLYQYGRTFPEYLRARLSSTASRWTSVRIFKDNRVAGNPDDPVARAKIQDDLRKQAIIYSAEFLGEDTLLNQIGAWVGCLSVFSALSFLTCLTLYPGVAHASFVLLSCAQLTMYALTVRFIEGHTPGQQFMMRVPYFTLTGILLAGYALTFLSSMAPATYPDSRAAATAMIASIKATCASKAEAVSVPKDYPYTATVCAPLMLAYLENSEEALAKGIDQLHVKDFTLPLPPRERFPESVAEPKFWDLPLLYVSQSSYLSVAHLRRFNALTFSTPSSQLRFSAVLLERH